MLSIPGTHDSATYSSHNLFQFGFSSQCQSWSILNQLKAGIRFLDLRVKMHQNKLITHHGIAKFDDLLNIVMQINWFLRTNPNEFLIAAFQGV